MTYRHVMSIAPGECLTYEGSIPTLTNELRWNRKHIEGWGEVTLPGRHVYSPDGWWTIRLTSNTPFVILTWRGGVVVDRIDVDFDHDDQASVDAWSRSMGLVIEG